MKTAYFDCFSGAAGDMIVASLLDAGADADALRRGLETLPVRGYTLGIERVAKQGIATTRFVVTLDAAAKQPHRHLQQVVEIIRGGKLPDRVRDRAISIFERLADAEARVHNASIDKVHFHEVGAVDAIVDVVGACLALEALAIDRVVCSPVPTGSGAVRCAHGLLPVPAPATALLLKGVPLAACDETGELTTPTGAAVLTTLAGQYGPIPAMTLESVGYGAGSRDGATRPNILRVLIGETCDTDAEVDSIVVLETNLDDASPQVVGFCIERLLAEGALDAYATPIQMKKHRPGSMLTVLCEPKHAGRMERMMFAQTTTFGVRRSTVQRSKLRRRHETVSTPYGDIRVKIGEGCGAATATPEYEDCKTAALTHDVPLREIIAAAESAWRARGAKRQG